MSADKILVMNQGRVIEQGTHEELLRRGGKYAELYHTQFDLANSG
jgi:ATP-binding cassette subfamily B protein